MTTDRRTFLGGALAAATLPKGTSGSDDVRTGDAGAPPAFPVLLLVLCGRFGGDAGERARTARRIVAVDLGSEDEWGDLNVFWDGTAPVWGLGNDVDGYWRVERAFVCPEAGGELHEGKYPFAAELTRDGLAVLMERRTSGKGAGR